MAKNNKKTDTSTGIEENIEALLAYLFGWISGLVFLLIEKKSDFAKFHAAQSIVVFGGLSILAIIFEFIPIIGKVLLGLTYILELVLWILLMIKAYQKEKFRVPIAADLADKLIGSVKNKK